jgi:hypothetical protein
MALAAALRSLALASVVLALGSPSLYSRTHAISVVYALDVSRSIDPAFLLTALDWMRQANTQYRPAHTSYVVFADHAELLKNLNDIQSVAVRQAGESDGTAAVDQSATDIEQAVAASMLGFLPDYAKRLVLITDGTRRKATCGANCRGCSRSACVTLPRPPGSGGKHGSIASGPGRGVSNSP